ncbi:helix-turn-helix transcriptional regulator [Pseudonocardia kujensis]|uniref:winged helix-turn-helix transcriptional regulator n=1 Tax=Pseudonocardia kujensis TaxID=1128675 RepID=UPI001E3C04E5|nr:helix-turn-helix domain-containing protein [Pseudonocardia kujensis]MCE0766215.1 helix-turn-helix transcriptional regulator [Pseudonocardia kujensis]
MRTYGQYCPVARAAELLAERWTLVIVRNLLAGCRTYGELLDGAPGISRALLTQRLDLLQEHEVVAREAAPSGRVRYRYTLTERGQELGPVVRAIGEWGARWLELEPHHSDPAYVLFATGRLIDVDRAPPRGLVVRVDLAERPAARYWLLVRRPRAEVCTSYPGRVEDLVLRTSSEVLARCHLRHLGFAQAERCGLLEIDGPRSVVRAFLACVRPSPYAHIPPKTTTRPPPRGVTAQRGSSAPTCSATM